MFKGTVLHGLDTSGQSTRDKPNSFLSGRWWSLWSISEVCLQTSGVQIQLHSLCFWISNAHSIHRYFPLAGFGTSREITKFGGITGHHGMHNISLLIKWEHCMAPESQGEMVCKKRNLSPQTLHRVFACKGCAIRYVHPKCRSFQVKASCRDWMCSTVAQKQIEVNE